MSHAEEQDFLPRKYQTGSPDSAILVPEEGSLFFINGSPSCSISLLFISRDSSFRFTVSCSDKNFLVSGLDQKNIKIRMTSEIFSPKFLKPIFSPNFQFQGDPCRNSN